jgi:cysteine protease ATG4
MQGLNVGILGGRPNEAYYLVGMQDDFLIFLDPHNTKEAVPGELDQIKLSHMEYHEATAKKIHYSKLDPSLGFAFLLRSSRDFAKFKSFLENGKKMHGSNWIFNTM